METEGDENIPPTNMDHDFSCAQAPLRPLFKHQWLDVKDSVDKWLEAQVIDVDGDKISIHYKGWKDKYDETLDTTSDSKIFERISPPLTNFHEHPPPYEGKMDLKVGQEVDIHDTTEKWCKGRVVEIVREAPNRYQALIHYDGWDSQYDEWVNLDSYRLAPLNHHTDPPCMVRRPSLHRSSSEYAPPQDEETKFRDELKRVKNWSIRDMAGDGNCLFRSVSHQIYGDAKYHALVREKCMDYVEAEITFFSNYIDGDVKVYVNRMRQDGEWGDNVEIQAMSEIYSRRVEIYAYNTEPMKTYQRHLGGSNPIRISYHCRSHYNSMVFPDLQQQWLRSQPGVWEDRAIAASRNRVRIRPNTQTQDEELKLALSLSRQEFKRGDNTFDSQIQMAIEVSKKSAVDPVEQAMINSVIDNEQTQMQKALQASMQDSKAGTADLDLERVLALSRQEHESKQTRKLTGESTDSKAAPTAKPAVTPNVSKTESSTGSGAAGEQKARPSGGEEIPSWLEALIRDMSLSRSKCLKAYERFKGDAVSQEILKTNIIMYCFS